MSEKRTKWTEGPWVLVGYNVYHDKDRPEHRRVAEVNRFGGLKEEEVEANARLIAAAPELVEALQALVKASEYLTGGTRVANAVFKVQVEHTKVLLKCIQGEEVAA